MKIKTKVTILFSVLIVAVLVLNLVFYTVLKTIHRAINDKTVLENNVSELSNRHIDHLLWLQNLSLQLMSDREKPITIQTDPALCSFGKWYVSGNWKNLFKEGSELNSLLLSLDEPHQALHKSASSIRQAQEDGKYSEAYDIFVMQTLPQIQKLSEIFHTVDTAGKNAAKEKTEEVFQLEQQSFFVSTSIGILVAVLLVIVITVILSIIAGFKDIISITGALAGGDFSIHIEKRKLEAQNEIGDMLRGTARMIQSVSSMLGTIKTVSEKLVENCGELTRSAGDTHLKGESIAELARKVNSDTNIQTSAVKTVSASITEIISGIKKLDASVEDQAAAVAESSAGIEEMIGNVSSINTNITKVSGMFGDLITASEEGMVKQKLVETEVSDIVTLSESLNETNKLIASLSSQTNLLAMNAAIESAHAGEAGQGFAVVADEIRKLAEKSSIQSKEIAKQLKEIRNGINSIVVSSGETRVAFDSIANKIGQTNTLVEEVSFAISEQTAGSQQILEGIRRINVITDDVRNGSKDMYKNSSQILGEIKELKEVSLSVSSNMDNIDRETDEITVETSGVLDIASKTKQLVEEVGLETAQFKTC